MEPTEVFALISAFILVLQNGNSYLPHLPSPLDSDDSDDGMSNSRSLELVDGVQTLMSTMNVMTSVVLHQFRVLAAFQFLDTDLGWWVKPRSTMWFAQFLLHEYDDSRWVQNFRFTKRAMFGMTQLLGPHVEKQHTRYCLAIPALIRVAVTFYKLTQGVSLLSCSELFAIGRSSISRAMREVVTAVTVVFRGQMSWPRGPALVASQIDFKSLCGIPGVVDAIDGTHIHISKPTSHAEDYYYFKSGGYSINCQAVVDRQKRFLDLFAGSPGCMNDARVLRRSGLYRQAAAGTLFEGAPLMDSFPPFLLGDKGFPLLPWLMVPFKTNAWQTVLETIFNRHHRHGRTVVENAFGFLKNTFRELLKKSELSVLFMPDVILACCLLHNMLLDQSPQEVQRLLKILHMEGMVCEVVDDDQEAPSQEPAMVVQANDLRGRLSVYIGQQRHLNF